jgi:2-phospho-L-lactate/phosphoenolpyruvate guanylyltransferase
MTAPVSIVIPLKGGPNAKSRLSAVLSPTERLALAHSMAMHVILSARASIAGERVTIVTGCPEMAALARGLGTQVVDDPFNAGTAAACMLAQPALEKTGPILFLSADLPLIQPHSLNAMTALDAAVVIAPDRHRIGTNALLVRPGAGVRPCFGQGSFARHCAVAAAANIVPRIFEDPAIAHDIDVPDDLAIQHTTQSIRERRSA